MSMKKINGYIIHMKEVLGKGSYGAVYKGEQEQTKKSCAIKVIDKKQIFSDQYLKAALLQQIQILQQVRSQNIVKVHEVMESTNNYYIIQQICESDLQKYIKANPIIQEKTATDIIKQIVNGFVALVKEGIIHRDIKPANILISQGKMKIGDFGFAKKNVSKKMKNQSSVGTPLYMSTEVLKAAPYSSKCDVWAIGFIFYEMLHHKTPWTAGSVYELVNNIETKPLLINPNLSQNTKSFLKRTLAIHEIDRASWDEVFEHPIFEKYFDIYRDSNKKIQDNLKVIMSRLRFKINSQNIDIKKLLDIMGFKSQKIELNFNQFKKFLEYISPQISEQEVRYFFDKVDEDCSGTISVQEIEKQMSKHQITIERSSKLRKTNTYQDQEGESKAATLCAELETKARKCFQKLYRVLNYKQLSLKKMFQAYDKQKKGNLSFQSFKHMICKLDQSFTEEDVLAVFEVIDIDHSKSIEFEELNTYYCKVNSIPETLE